MIKIDRNHKIMGYNQQMILIDQHPEMAHKTKSKRVPLFFAISTIETVSPTLRSYRCGHFRFGKICPLFSTNKFALCNLACQFIVSITILV